MSSQTFHLFWVRPNQLSLRVDIRGEPIAADVEDKPNENFWWGHAAASDAAHQACKATNHIRLIVFQAVGQATEQAPSTPSVLAQLQGALAKETNPIVRAALEAAIKAQKEDKPLYVTALEPAGEKIEIPADIVNEKARAFAKPEVKKFTFKTN